MEKDVKKHENSALQTDLQAGNLPIQPVPAQATENATQTSQSLAEQPAQPTTPQSATQPTQSIAEKPTQTPVETMQAPTAEPIPENTAVANNIEVETTSMTTESRGFLKVAEERRKAERKETEESEAYNKVMDYAAGILSDQSTNSTADEVGGDNRPDAEENNNIEIQADDMDHAKSTFQADDFDNADKFDS